MIGIKDFEMPSCCNNCNHWSFSRDDEPLCDLTYEYISQFDKRQEDCPLVETYTKADLVTILTEIKKEIHEISTTPNTSKGFKLGQATAYYKCEFLVEQKINELREGEL